MKIRRAASSSASLFSLVAVLLAVTIAAGLLWRGSVRRGGQHAALSIRRSDSEGAAVLFELLRRSGLRPRPWENDWRRLQDPGLLFILDGETSGGEPLPPELRALDEWVRRGGVAVVAGMRDGGVAQRMGLPVEPKMLARFAPAEPVQPGPLTDGVSSVAFQSTGGIQLSGRKPLQPEQASGLAVPVPRSHWLALCAAERTGVVQAAAAVRGRGMYILLADPWPAGNAGIGEADNARFLFNLASAAPEGRIWFDEYHKREPISGLAAYLRETSLAPAALYLLLLLGLACWRAGSRLGEPLDPSVTEARDTREYVDGLAALYRNAGLSREALRLIRDDFIRRLSPRGNVEDAAQHFASRTGTEPDALLAALRRADEEIGRTGRDRSGALSAAAELSRLQELYRARGRRNRE